MVSVSRNARIAALAFVALVPVTAFAEALATIKGVVFSAEGKPVAGATVKAGATSATTDKTGLFTLKVKPGTYDVVASHPRFSPDTQKGVMAQVGKEKDISAILMPR